MFSDLRIPFRSGGDKKYDSTMVTTARALRNQTPCQKTRPMAPNPFPLSQASPLRRPIMICAPMEKPNPSMYRMVKYTPAMADAPSSISPTRPRKAVSVMPSSSSITSATRIGKVILQMDLKEYRSGSKKSLPVFMPYL